MDPVADERSAKFVTGTRSHMRNITTQERELANDEDPANLIPPDDVPNDHPERCTLIPQQLLCKYTQYAWTNVRPFASSGVPIVVRHVESIM